MRSSKLPPELQKEISNIVEDLSTAIRKAILSAFAAGYKTREKQENKSE